MLRIPTLLVMALPQSFLQYLWYIFGTMAENSRDLLFISKEIILMALDILSTGFLLMPVLCIMINHKQFQHFYINHLHIYVWAYGHFWLYFFSEAFVSFLWP